LAERIPAFPKDFLQRLDEPLSDVFPHGRLNAVILACQTMQPGLSREAFLADPTCRDILSWMADIDPTESSGKIGRFDYRSANVGLRPIVDPDVPQLYMASLDPRVNHRWRFKGRTPSIQVFASVLFSDAMTAQFMVHLAHDPGAAIGHVSAYNADHIARHCTVALQRVDGGSQHGSSRGLMVEGFLLFVQYLFDHFDFQKIYLEVPEYNLSLLGPATGGLLVEEACLSDHLYFGGRLWKQYFYSLTRNEWDELAELYLADYVESI
jgi:RimJ/RimL family protein N-acetyltransferase